VTTEEERWASSPEEAVVHIFFADPDKPSHRVASGTGFVIDAAGVIVTAAHVVDGSKFIDIKFPVADSREEAVFIPARIITTDTDRDVALLKVDPAGHEGLLRPVRLAERTDLVGVGSEVVVYGFPESNVVGLEIRRTSGTVSSHRMNPINRSDKKTKMLEIEAKIEPGNSGSPVFDDRGRVVGVVSSRWQTTDGYGLAAPVNVVRDLLEERYDKDLQSTYSELRTIPRTVLGDVQAAYDLAVDMRGRFGVGDDGYRRAKSLEFCMGRVLTEGELGLAALERQEVANAWRHLQLLSHEVHTHRQDIAILESARTVLNSVE
jgi:S1-C subfamily serine protease